MKGLLFLRLYTGVLAFPLPRGACSHPRGKLRLLANILSRCR